MSTNHTAKKMHTTATDAHGTAENSYMVSAILHNRPLWCRLHHLWLVWVRIL